MNIESQIEAYIQRQIERKMKPFRDLAERLIEKGDEPTEEQRVQHLKWMTVDDAAIYLRKSKSAIYKATSEGKVKHAKENGRNFYKRAWLDQYRRDFAEVVDPVKQVGIA